MGKWLKALSGASEVNIEGAKKIMNDGDNSECNLEEWDNFCDSTVTPLMEKGYKNGVKDGSLMAICLLGATLGIAKVVNDVKAAVKKKKRSKEKEENEEE